MIKQGSAIFLFLFVSFVVAQPTKYITKGIKDIDPNALPINGKSYIDVRHFRLVEMDLNYLRVELEGVSHRFQPKSGIKAVIKLPLPNGSMHTYQVVENNIMHPQLAARYPEIKTYDAFSVDNAKETVKLDITPHGFHAMIMRPGKSTVFIDPYWKDNDRYYIVYRQKDLIAKKREPCLVKGQKQHFHPNQETNQSHRFASCELRTYRLAMAATAQYTQFFGGTVPMALAAQVTMMNRVNGIFERDIAVTMQFIPNNDLLIYTNPNTQPYTSGNAGAMLIQNQNNVTNIIGTENFDIGHVVDASNAGGLAQLAGVCNPTIKAAGVSTSLEPVGDPFYVGYVSHEMGHQFGAEHTQNNNCNRNNPTAVEPGSGSTIMSYAGLCAPNVQPLQSGYFHGINLQEMGNFISEPTHTCAVKTPISPAPIITDTNGFATVPVNTPFALSATVASQNDNLTFDWEQMDNQITPQPPVSIATGGPNFRSFEPSLDSTRYFPNLIALANHGPFTWEVLPSVSRTMNYQVTVRGNESGGSCNAFTNVTVTTDANSGPFVVTYPSNAGIIWQGGSSQLVRWDVAGTDQPPVNTRDVDILLSIDGGISYPFALAQKVPNVGVASITVPNYSTQAARIMVRSAEWTFFNISDNNFTISAIPPTALLLTSAVRNPMSPTVAFIYYAGEISSVFKDAYILNGLSGANLLLDAANHRFIVKNITIAQRVNISISIAREGGFSEASNWITIPGIL